ncbi:hypothetical protein LWI29_031032 [Acer saccharum]|uniref:P-type ATPase A domain-containing protein n=1 Tax=Acer saccharum TaxID=4024 RepID=A0AA39VLG0_ACESA|nr:hypothetical protein LWI29_031032 [Acer saccharum]
MSDSKIPHYGCSTLLFKVTTTTLTKSQKRWRLAYWTIYSFRAMRSLVHKNKPNHQYSEILQSHPYVALDIEPSSSLHQDKKSVSYSIDPNVEGSKLTDIVKKKDLHSLGCIGGVEGVATALGTNPEDGIDGNDEDVAKRSQLFEHGAEEGWYEGGSIFVAVFLLRLLEMLAAGLFPYLTLLLEMLSSLKIGDQIPADGLFLGGYSLQVDESSMTGESDHVEVDFTNNPFLFSGSKVADGYGKMLVVSVGMDTAWGEMMSSISSDSNERTPLQARLDRLTSSIGTVGLVVALLVLVVLLIRYFTGNTKDENGAKEYNGGKTDIDDVFNAVIRIFAAAVTIVVVAIPEGLPLAVTLTLAYSMKRMMADQAMVRKLPACETMGSATVICTDKTGTLTLNQMKVTKFWLGQESIEEDSYNVIVSDVGELIHQGVGLNTTGSVCKPASGSSVSEFSGSPTEKAILSWAVQELDMDMEKLKQKYSILHVETFNSEKKRSGVSIRKIADNTLHVHWKGAAEMILAMCSHYYESNGIIKSMDEDGRSKMETIIHGMAASSLRCIAFAHKQISAEELEYNDNGKTRKMLKEDGLTLLGIVGLKDPCRPGVQKAVEVCTAAGVDIKMITGDNVFTAKAIATECGILNFNQQEEAGEVVEGVEFRNYTPEERMQKVDKIRVMARSSPFDKLLMVQCLKQKGHVVAVTGDGTNDAPALKKPI